MKTRLSWSYLLASLAIIAGAVLTAVSWLKLCSTSCNDAHNFRLFGMPFEVGGAAYFGLLAFLHFGSLKKAELADWVPPLVAIGLGAEVFFIGLQKYVIQSYCPVCLSIAASIAVLGLCYWKFNHWGGFKMRNLFGIFLMGIAASYFGLSKIDQLEAVEDRIKEQIKFGNQQSPIEVYIFTDWACPACRAIEPKIEAMAPKVAQQARIVFVDTVVHPETLNYAPYNLSFMVNNKSNYFEIRNALSKLSLTNKKPNDQDVAKAIAPLRVTYKELPYQDVTVAMRYFDDLVERFKVTGTPTVAIVNLDSKKGKKLAGAEEITESNILKAINTLR